MTPHAGGAGLWEAVQFFAFFNAADIAARLHERPA